MGCLRRSDQIRVLCPIITDYKAIRLIICLKKEKTSYIRRSWLAMQEFDFSIEHHAGQRRQHVDALSRSAIKVNAITTTDWVQAVQSQNEDIQLI